MTAPTLVEWLTARLAEDEEDSRLLALTAPPPLTSNPIDHPDRVLAECEAKRRILELHATDKRWPLDRSRVGCRTCRLRGDGSVNNEWPCETLRALASVYRDAPGYRTEWQI